MNDIDTLRVGARPYVEGIALGVLRYQRCADCDAPQTLARFACQRCGSLNLGWHDSTGHGVVYAMTVVTRAPSEEFKALAPYTLVLVDLDEGPRVMAHGTFGLAIGNEVSVQAFAHADKSLMLFSTPEGAQ
jgi:uncharacterized OB-fold protein